MIPETPKYEFIDDPSIKDFVCIKILDGVFSQIEYFYSYVKFGNDVENKPFELDFHYNITKGIAEDSKKFEAVAAAILTEIIITKLK